MRVCFKFFVLILALNGVCIAAGSKINVLHRGSASELRSLDPQVAIGNTATGLMADLFEGLVSYDVAGKLVPGAAESWDISNDGLTYTFYLRKGMHWSDGRGLAAEDFVYSFQRVVDPANALRGAGLIFPIRNAVAIVRGELPPSALGVHAENALTVKISLTNPAPYFLEILAAYSTAPMPSHVIEKHGAGWSTPGKMVTNGAYVLEEWVPNTYYRLVRNPFYRNASEVAIDEVYYYPVPDINTAIKRYRAGELDIVLNLPPNRLEWFQRTMPDELWVSNAVGIRYLVLNTVKAPLDDVRVRVALDLAIDRELIVSRILKDGSTPSLRLVPHALASGSEISRNEEGKPRQEKIALAKQLLSDAGFDKDQPVRITLIYKPLEQARRVVIALQAMWREIGVETALVNTGSQGLLNRLTTGDFNVAWSTYYAPFNDAVAFLLLLASDSSRNYSGYAQPKFDALLGDADRTVSPEERAARLGQAEDLALKDHPVIPLFVPARSYLVSPRVYGWSGGSRLHLTRHLKIVD